MTRHLLLASLLGGLALPAAAAEWSTTELHYQHGRLAAPVFAGGAASATHILTLQHASGWGFGDLFAFVDRLDDARADGFNDRDGYAEAYLNLSAGKLSGADVGFGVIRDVGLLLGVNAAADAKVRKYLPGLRLSWEVPGLAFLNTDLTAYIDDSDGVAAGGAPAEGDAWMLDVNWAYPFQWHGHAFSIEGHAEYIGGRDNEVGGRAEPWILAQPQFRYDLGQDLWQRPGHLFVGIEWQWWRNKLGDAATDENAAQALVVWRF